ncbi:MAG: hypothetical protein ACTSVO_00650 [Candidatus Heimdallarchaeaceae archaeon]
MGEVSIRLHLQDHIFVSSLYITLLVILRGGETYKKTTRKKLTIKLFY